MKKQQKTVQTSPIIKLLIPFFRKGISILEKNRKVLILKKSLFLTFLVIQTMPIVRTSLYAAPPLYSVNVTEYDPGIFEFDLQPSFNAPEIRCFCILPDGTPRSSCDFIHQFPLPIDNTATVLQYRLKKIPIPPQVISIPINSNPSHARTHPSFSENPRLKIGGAVHLYPSWDIYIPTIAGEPQSPYVIMVLAIENDFCDDSVDGHITIQTNPNVSILDTQITTFTGSQQGFYVPSQWNANTPVTVTSPNTNFQSQQEICVNFSDLAPNEQRFVYFVTQVNPAVSISTGINWTVSLVADSSSEKADPCPMSEIDNVSMTVNQHPWDPNTKTASKTVMSPNAPSEDIIYKIGFKNEGAYFAKDVFIVDELSDQFDLSSLQLIDASHSCPEVVLADNKAYFFFKDIQLPGTKQQNPNHYAPPDCEGWLKFSIKTKANQASNSYIKNDAEIFFTAETPAQVLCPSVPNLSNIANANIDISYPMQLGSFFIQEANTLPFSMQNGFVTEFSDFILNNSCTVVLEPVTTPQAQTTFKQLDHLYSENLVAPVSSTEWELLIGEGIPLFPQPQSYNQPPYYLTNHSSIGNANQTNNSCNSLATIIPAFPIPISSTNNSSNIGDLGFGVYKNQIEENQAEELISIQEI